MGLTTDEGQGTIGLQVNDMSDNNNNTLLYDEVIHVTCESTLSRDEQVRHVTRLFPHFNDIDIYDDFVGSYEIEKYMHARSMGMNAEQSAHAAELSTKLINNVLIGIGVTLETFINIAKAEVFAQSTMISSLLSAVHMANSNTEVNAALQLLEKIAPEKYGKNSHLMKDEKGNNVLINFSVREEDD